MDKLEILMASGNKLAAIPESFGSFKNLRELVLDENEIEYAPASLADCKTLQILSLVSNPLVGDLPKSLTGKPGLRIET